MAAISGKVGAAPAVASGEHPLPQTALPVPPSLAETLPTGLPRGAVAVLTGARSLMLGMVAAVTAAGGNAAIVGLPDIGLLAAVEMGADLSRLAVIADPGKDPVEVAAVLLDGMDLVVLGLAGCSVTPAQARVVTSRARQRGCALLVADGDWPAAALRLEARVRGYEMACATPGSGRIGAVRLGVRAWGRQAARTRAG